MKEYPILFSAPMVRANRSGLKRMTRRIVTVPWHKGKRCLPYEPYFEDVDGVLHCTDKYGDSHVFADVRTSPYGEPGDKIWVRETWADINSYGEAAIAYKAGNDTVYFVGSPHENGIFLVDDSVLEPYSFAVWGDDLFSGSSKGWHLSIHMPRWASRDVYTVTGVRVERLQAITEADAMAEGIEAEYSRFDFPPRMAFSMLWDSINGKRPGHTWKDNPWVWVVEYDNPACK
ncbi:hypothetical protein LJC48_01040 [Desulfovibrio sp. OttesenSCG-928-C06]|nr:hypothetical protein [Desulfovibrio sp. OttesenSCG-928-C06]